MLVRSFSLLFVCRFHGLFLGTSRPRASAIRPSRSLPSTRSTAPSASRSKPPLAVLPVGERFPNQPPAVPLRNSDSSSLADLHCWRAEVISAEHGVRSAQIAHEAAQAQERLAASMVSEATERRLTAWKAYMVHMGMSASDLPPPIGTGTAARPAALSADKGKGKGKERAPSSSEGEDEDEDGEEEIVSRELEGGGAGGVGGSGNPMDLS